MTAECNEADDSASTVWLLDLLDKAMANLENPYFSLPIDGQNVPIYRERVYAYELYHQLRAVWPKDSPFVVSGEVDKSGHPFFREGLLDQAKPDLLIHTPGRMSGNLVIVEIKRANAPKEEIADDLRKISAFCTDAQYHLGVLVLFGANERSAVETKCRDAFLSAGRRCNASLIRVVWQEAAGQGATSVGFDFSRQARDPKLLPRVEDLRLEDPEHR